MTDVSQIDTRGLRCPLPVLKARKALAGYPAGTVLCVLSDDDMALIDMPHFCQEAGHDYLGVTNLPDGHSHMIRKGG